LSQFCHISVRTGTRRISSSPRATTTLLESAVLTASRWLAADCRPVRRSTHGIAIAASSGAGPTWQENSLIPITRNGRREDVYWTYSYGPIDDKDAPNEIGGVPVVCTETTPQVLIAQRAGQERERFAAAGSNPRRDGGGGLLRAGH
jgi:hypothetical protein